MIVPPIILNNITNAFVDFSKFALNIRSNVIHLAYLSIARIFLYKINIPPPIRIYLFKYFTAFYQDLNLQLNKKFYHKKNNNNSCLECAGTAFF